MNGSLVSGSYDKTLTIWNQTTGELIQTIGPTLEILSLTVLQNGNLASRSFVEKIIKIWGLENEGTLSIYL